MTRSTILAASSRRSAPPASERRVPGVAEARAFKPTFLRAGFGLVLGVQPSRTGGAGHRVLGRVRGLGIEPESFKQYTEGDDLRFT